MFGTPAKHLDTVCDIFVYKKDQTHNSDRLVFKY